MITNSFISLKPDSQERLDALNTIKYTLLLDYELPETAPDNRNFISDLMESCHKCCKGLFIESDYTPEYNFFGRLNLEYPSPFLGHMIFPIKDNSNPLKDSPGIHTIILQHCVLSSYHAILTELLHDQTVKAYTIYNKLESNGFQSLLIKKTVTRIKAKDKDKENYKYKIPNGEAKEKSSTNAIGLSKSIKSHAKVDALYNVMELLTDKDSGDYKLQFSELFYQICSINAPEWKVLNSLTDKQKNKRTIQKRLNGIEGACEKNSVKE